MGRIKTIGIKKLAEEMVKEHASIFSNDFSKNKAALQKVRPIKSKKVRNVLAGYITKKIKAIKRSGL